MKPEMTVPTALGALLRWSWLVLALTLVGAGVGGVLAAHQPKTYIATADVKFTQYQPGLYKHTGFLQPQPVPLRNAADWTLGTFQDATDASEVAKKTGGITGPRLLTGLQLTPISTSEVLIGYAASSAAKATSILNGYLKTFLASYQGNVNNQIASTLTSINTQVARISRSNPPPDSGLARSLEDMQTQQSALRTLRSQLKTQFGYTPATGARLSSRTISRPVAVAGGALAGFAGGILLVLTGARLRGRVDHPSELEELGVPVIELDSGKGADLLRLQLDVMGVGRGLRSVVVSDIRLEDGRTGTALALARAYAATDVRTLLISADPEANHRSDLAGVGEFLAGETQELLPYAVSPTLSWVPPGAFGADFRRLFTSANVGRLFAAASRHAQVIVVETGPLVDQAEAALPLACADAVVLVARRRRTPRVALAAALREAIRAATRSPVVCMDHADPKGAELVPRIASRSERIVSASPVSGGSALDLPDAT